MKFLTPAFVTLAMLVVVGLLIGGYFVKGLLATDDTPASPSTENVPMAISDIPAGTLITEAHLGPGRLAVAKKQSAPDILLNNRVIVGRVAKETIKAATAIRSSQLYGPGEFPALEVEDGMRAVSIGIGSSTQFVSGLIQPGQFVDVHLTPTGMESDERAEGGFTLTLFKGVKVLAVNRGTRVAGVGDRGGNQVTMELTPRQANIVILAEQRGSLTMTYNPQGKGDGGVLGSDDDRATWNEILGLKPLPEPVPPFVTEHYRGSSRTPVEFRNGKHADLDYRGDRNGAGGRPAPYLPNANPSAVPLPGAPPTPGGSDFPSAQNPLLRGVTGSRT